MSAHLCMPGRGLSCFACCPPIRPAGYEHLADRNIWRRIFGENHRAWRQGRLPDRPITGFSCYGLGFLDPGGRRVGCLLHPARNQGRDLRRRTGFGDKCARETCPQYRAFAALSPQARRRLLELCAGMDPFLFSSRRRNPVMRLLALGPEVAAAAANLGLADADSLAALAWLWELEPAWGWLLARVVARQGDSYLLLPELAGQVHALAADLTRRLGPPPPLEIGRPLPELCDEWEARFWRAVTGRRRARPGELAAWRRAAEESL